MGMMFSPACQTQNNAVESASCCALVLLIGYAVEARYLETTVPCDVLCLRIAAYGANMLLLLQQEMVMTYTMY